MAVVSDKGELTALARSYANGEIDVDTYRANRAIMIDKYCGVEAPRTRFNPNDQEAERQEENSLLFYSLLGAFGVLFFIFIIYLITTTDLALTFQQIQPLLILDQEFLFS
jgi:hypothetical protein